MAQFHFFPPRYLETIRNALPAYDRLQEELAGATDRLAVRSALDLGTGTGETARRVLELHEWAQMVCIDRSASMLRLARRSLPPERVLLRLQDLTEPLPGASFDLITSALAIHHLDGPEKRRLFKRIAAALSKEGLFVMADVVVPDDPGAAVTPLDPRHDRPSRLADQLLWMSEGGLDPELRWSEKDLAVVVASHRSRGARRVSRPPQTRPGREHD